MGHHPMSKAWAGVRVTKSERPGHRHRALEGSARRLGFGGDGAGALIQAANVNSIRVCKKMGKLAGRRVTFHAPARMGAIAAALAAAAALLLPNTALAATEIGSAQGNTLCNQTGFDSVQTSAGGGVSYEVPSGGTSITSWRVQAGPETA